MKIPTLKLILIVSVIFFSCGNDELRNKSSSAAPTPKALDDDNGEIISIKRSYRNNIVEELYEELADKYSALQNIETSLENSEKLRAELAGKFSKYNSKSDKYYSDAGYISESISDSLLKQKMKAIIETSLNSNKENLSGINKLNDQIIKNSVTIKDLHSAMTIMLTLPLIEKYQKDNFPDKKDFDAVVKEQNKVIQSLDSAIQK